MHARYLALLASSAAALLVQGCAARDGRMLSAAEPAVAPAHLALEASPARRLSESLTAGNREAWRSHIRPGAVDLAYAELPWWPTFHEGVLAAAEEEKPLLLWVMNGHPLGCT